MALREIVLARRGLAYVEPRDTMPAEGCDDAMLRAFELELAAVGYVASTRLRGRLARSSTDELLAARDWICSALLAQVGGDRKHVPLFRSFPWRVPKDTLELWWDKVLVHFLQGEGQPCIFCGSSGTTHVLNPCLHVVCDRCFDGSSYSACPVCEHHVDRSSPFFREPEQRGTPVEQIVFKRIDLAEDLDAEVRALFALFCERKQAMSALDRDALIGIVSHYKTDVLAWLPESIAVRENVAVIFGTLLRECDPAVVIDAAKRFLKTATDVLRLLAVYSGTDGSLLPETMFKPAIQFDAKRTRFWGRIAKLIGAIPPGPLASRITIPIRVHRFRMARLSRPLRRALFAILESFDAEGLTEDMLRHRSYWVWAGEFLHPHEYAARYPNVARAFQIVRKKAPDRTRAPRFATWYARVERRILEREVPELLAILGERPGELARRLDHALRLAGSDRTSIDLVLTAFEKNIGSLATPVLLTLDAHLRHRDRRAAVRVYWPKGRVAMGASTRDRRPVLQPETIGAAVRIIEAELLRRFAAKPAAADCVVDAALESVIAPFNERTSTRAAVVLPRGSRIAISREKHARLFMHWCQPKGQEATDLDLSVAFYDRDWRYAGVCSYYALTFNDVATSAGDLRDAPWPDGATEFIDIDRNAARAAGIRYAVMVVNNYGGLPFTLLERAFAGLMLRDDLLGTHFDPRTVELRFDITGENGVYLPLVFDIEEGTLHWLDVQARGELEMNNVETSKSAIARLCPELIAYFASGTRMSVYELSLLHAAARSQRVLLRGGDAIAEFVRRESEDAAAFLERLRNGAPDARHANMPPLDSPLLAMLFRGDVDLPADASVYALFRERVTPTFGASDLSS